MTTLQQPIGSGFSAASTASDVIKGIGLTGKNVIVTGGYSGLGREAVRTLTLAGATVIVPSRDVERAQKNLEGIDHVTVEFMDLLDPASIDAFADKFLATGRPLDILINSAGIMANSLSRDSRGYESQFATNHLGHFQLTLRLIPALKKAKGSRVVSVSSLGHRFSDVHFEDPNFMKRDYDRWLAYGQSKTANILFALEFDRLYKEEGIRAFSVHPGSIVGTGLDKHLTREELIAGGVLDADGKPIYDPSKQLKTVEQGAATLVWAATNPKLDGMGGVYCENNEVAAAGLKSLPMLRDIGDAARLTGVMAFAVDPESALKLWHLSLELLKA